MSLQYKYLMYYCTLLLLIFSPACQCKKDAVVSPGEIPPPPVPPANDYLVTAIFVNGIPKDSLIYNKKNQVTERWEFHSYYRLWLSHTVYRYNSNGYVKEAEYYNEVAYNVKGRTQKDSLVWAPGLLTIYTTFYRLQDGAVSGSDVSKLALNNNNQVITAGTRDTIIYTIVKGKFLSYIGYEFTGNDIRELMDMTYVAIENSVPVTNIQHFKMDYDEGRLNPLYPAVAGNPLLLRALAGDVYPLPRNELYPYLCSKHYVTQVQKITESGPPVSSVAVYTKDETSRYASTQTLGNHGITISYHYRKAD
ncbi:MAG TPA: hypothetical protein VM802_20605 [Chitinophaga sp.]|uniref:hypothetical protein n=1 Tax=Chitinophaga sp. TaxID=1869181 RepID=UPI002C4BFA30|nr:hypothetical protein [Chitinophaga sp.]HVI47291.1 hypothetical protein [Chitinophaga sp.]